MLHHAINQPDLRYNRKLETRLITEPSGQPVTLQEARDFLAVTTTDADILINSVLLASVSHVEQQVRRAFMPQTWEVCYPSFPLDGEPMRPVFPPTISITSVSYFDLAGVSQTWNSSNYTSILFQGPRPSPGVVRPNVGVAYPSTYERDDAVTIRFVAGYVNPEQIPKQLRYAILMLMAHWYEHREAVAENGVQLAKVGLAYDSIINSHRWYG